MVEVPQVLLYVQVAEHGVASFASDVTITGNFSLNEQKRFLTCLHYFQLLFQIKFPSLMTSWVITHTSLW